MPAQEGDLEYGDLTSISRSEASSGSLTSVRKDLYPAMAALYEKKCKECEKIIRSNADSILFEGASDKKRKTLKAMKDVTEKRMKKIFDLAMRGGMGADNITDTLTPEEKELYDTLYAAAKAHWNLLERKKTAVIPDITQPDVIPEPPIEQPTVIGKTVENVTEDPEVPQTEVIEVAESNAVPLDVEFTEIPEDEDEDPRNITIDVPAEIPSEKITETPIPEVKEETEDIDSMSLTLIRMTSDLEQEISGIDRTYNLKKEDVVRLPGLLAKVLVNRGLAKVINRA